MAEWKKVIVSGSSPEFGAITVDGTVTAASFSGDGSSLTGVAAGSIDIDNFSAGTTIEQTDKFLYSDGGTEKSVTFSNLEDAVFGNVSGDATIAAGGALTIANTSVTNGMLAGSIANAKLSNSAITIAGNSTSLGGSITTATILDGTGVLSGSAQIQSDINDLADARIAAASVTAHSDVSDAGSGAIITSAERTKLNGIETSADVTDVTNVRGAGALMDDEITNLAQVKAFASSDYATAAQGTTADSALQDITGESVTDLSDVSSAGSGAIITSTERTKLNGIETSADVTDSTNVQNAGALMDSEVTSLALIKGLTAATISGSISSTSVAAAGALMDSEVTNLAQVKAFDSTDYATSAQGTKADNALPASDVSAFGATLIDDANASTARTTLGLGSIATLSSIDISSNTNLAAGTGVTLTGDTLSIGQSVGTSDNVTFANITATGDLMVQGTLTSLQTTNLNIEDQFILLNSGSADAQSQGIVFGGSTGTQGVGEAFFYDLDADRPAWSSNAVAWNATSAAETAFIPRVFDVDGSSHTPINEVGSIQVTGGEILIYA